MKKPGGMLYAAGVALVLTGAVFAQAGDCGESDPALSLNFETASTGPCARLAPARFELEVRPEAEPINASPWYAARIESMNGGPVDIVLDYHGAAHRYPPWMLGPEGDWHTVPDDRVEISEKERRVEVALELEPGVTLFAAQPIYAPARHRELIDSLAALEGVERRVIGRSVESRPIDAVIARVKDRDASWLILLGHQHPPEMNGAWAMEAFLAEVFSSDAEAAAFRERVNIAAVPLLNPDGLAHGHWRLNAARTDLNRSWGEFDQPETAAVDRFIDSELGSLEFQDLLIDFHATTGARIYVPRRGDVPDGQIAFLDGWFDAMTSISIQNCERGGQQRCEARSEVLLPERRATRSRLPVTAKSYVSTHTAALAVTFEASEHADPQTSAVRGRLAARALMRTGLPGE